MTISCQGVTMVLPDMICVYVHDSPITKQPITLEPSPPSSNAYADVWFTAANGKKSFVIGKNREAYHHEVVRGNLYLNRAIADVAGGWGTVGGLTVTAVYRKSMPYDAGECAGTSGSQNTKAVSMRHKLYLQLSGNLAEGAHTITFPDDIEINADTDATSNLAAYDFTFDDKVTRFEALRANQYGYAPSDTMKFGYVAEWIPGYGTEGRVSYSGITDWHLINEAGTIVWSAGAAPVLRVAATDSEPNTGIGVHDSRLTSTTQTIRTIVSPGYTNANPCVLTYTGDTIADGTIIRIEDIVSSVGNMSLNCDASRPANFKTVSGDPSNPSAKTVALQHGPNGIGTANTNYDRSAGTATWVSGGKIYETQAGVNRAATNVYGLDFSAYTSGNGTYRIYIEGYGVSYPFYLDHAVWHNVAANMAAGEYHHRHETACDGRFGYTTGKSFGASYTPIFKNLLPYAFSSEVGAPGGVITEIVSNSLTTSAMHTSDTVDYAPGHMDAGDKDARIGTHTCAYYGFMDFYDQFPTAASATDWNIPKMTEIFPGDNTYGGTDILPDCLQQAMFALYGYIRLITDDGHCRGGLNNTTGGGITTGWYFRSGNGDPATTSTVFVYGPDHISTIMLCCLVGKMAIVLRKWDTLHSTTTFATLAQSYEDIAVDLWTAAELIWDSGSAWGSGSTGAVDTARDVLYGDYKTAADSLSSGTFASVAFGDSTVSGSRQQRYSDGHRQAAAAVLYRLTADTDYAAIVEADAATDVSLKHGIAFWEYINTTHGTVDTAKQATFKTRFTNFASGQYTDAIYGDTGFKSLRQAGSSASFGTDGSDWEYKPIPLIAAYLILERATPGSGATIKKALQDGWHWGLGANLTGKSFVTGLGSDTPQMALHDNSMGAGIDLPKGMWLYSISHRNGGVGLTYGTGPLNWLTMNSPASTTLDHEHYRKVEPTWYAWPQHQHSFGVPGNIEHSEYVFGGTIGPQQWVAAMLWADNGELQTELGATPTQGMALGLQFRI